MRRFFEWLAKPWKVQPKMFVWYVFLASALSIGYVFVAFYPIQYFFADIFFWTKVMRDETWKRILFGLFSFFTVALIEEFIFRILPLGFIHWYLRGGKHHLAVLVVFSLLFSFLYASAHYYLIGKDAIFIFGVPGMIWSLLAVKMFSGSYKNQREKYIYALFATTGTHVFFDFATNPFLYVLAN